MKNKRSAIANFYHMATFMVFAFGAYKIASFLRAGISEKTRNDIDSSIGAAAKKIEKAAKTMEKWAFSGHWKSRGKGLDKAVTDTKKAFDTISDDIVSASNRN
jgi:hypothetical protein